MLVEKYDWEIEKNLFGETNQDSTFSQTRENSKMINITSKCFSFLNKKPPARRVVDIRRDFLIYYSYSYYSCKSTLRKSRYIFGSLTTIFVKR